MEDDSTIYLVGACRPKEELKFILKKAFPKTEEKNKIFKGNRLEIRSGDKLALLEDEREVIVVSHWMFF